jgi:hypothetical protein
MLRNGEHSAYPRICHFAYCFRILNVYDKELWELLEYKINEDEFYTNFKESVYGV